MPDSAHVCLTAGPNGKQCRHGLRRRCHRALTSSFLLKLAAESRRAAQGQKTAVERILKVLDQVEDVARQTHLVDKTSRFDNPAFSTFYDEVETVNRWLLSSCLPSAQTTEQMSNKRLPFTPNLACRKRRHLNCRCTLSIRGATMNASTMEAGWNSFFCADIELVLLHPPRVPIN